MTRQAIINAIHDADGCVDITLIAASGYAPAKVVLRVPVIGGQVSRLSVGSVVAAQSTDFGRWYVDFSSGSTVGGEGWWRD